MIDNGLYDEGYLVTIGPALNYHVQDAAEAYHAHLREPEDGKVRFVNLTLEDVIETIRLSDQAHAEALHRRYCDFWLVDGELELNAARFGLPAKRPTRKPAEPSKDTANPAPENPSGVSRGTSRRRPKRIDFVPNCHWLPMFISKPMPSASEIARRRAATRTRASGRAKAAARFPAEFLP